MTSDVSRCDVVFEGMRGHLHRETDRMFAKLLIVQWVFAVVLALLISPWSYQGDERFLHFHVRIAFAFGALVNALPLALIYLRPGWWGTRHTIAAVQIVWSALFIMITGGRIETHFHVFGSLAFLATYRDWKLLSTATIVVAADHLARGLWWPDSVYGVANPEWWRFLEHAGWVVFEDVVLAYACIRGMREMRQAARQLAELEHTKDQVERKVAERTAELQESAQRYRSLVEDTEAVPFELDGHTLAIKYIAPRAAQLFDCELAELEGKHFLLKLVHPDDVMRVLETVQAYGRGEIAAETLDYRIITRVGRELHLRTLLSSRAHGRIRGLTVDITKQHRLELELQQAQKLESVGRLAAGVAHEINTPVQFVGDSVQFVRATAAELLELVRQQRATIDSLAVQPSPELVRACEAAAESIDLAYLAVEVPKALDRAIEGLDRVATIVRGLKVFAHPGGALSTIDLNQAVESTLTIARNEYRYVADLETDLVHDLPKVTCHAGEINQAVLNLVLNASHAIGDLVSRTKQRGKLTVRTHVDGDDVVIAIGDTGPGIPEHIQRKMFDPFFTTKPVGRGTGQGLSIARAIVDKHHGSLTCQTTLGVGTTFFLRLPMVPAAATERAA